MKLPLRSPLCRVLVVLGLALAGVNLLLLILADTLRSQVGEIALLAFAVAGVVAILFAIVLDRFPGTPTQP